jgi:hypothetical protein
MRRAERQHDRTDPDMKGLYPLSIYGDLEARSVRDGDQWGPWVYRANRTLEHADGHYWVDMDRMGTSAEILDWLAQVSKKRWCTRATAGWLLQAIDEIIDVQGTRCSFGIERGEGTT